LKNATTYCNEGSVKLFGYDGSLEISVKTADKVLYVIRNVMIFKNFVNEVMMDFAKCIFKRIE
jgi:hypothetical protein